MTDFMDRINYDRQSIPKANIITIRYIVRVQFSAHFRAYMKMVADF